MGLNMLAVAPDADPSSFVEQGFMAKKYSIKQILLNDNAWWKFYEKNEAKLRPGIVQAIVKLLSCKNTIRGYNEYHCSNQNCSHVKRVHHTCKSKACSSCGKKATEIWIKKQQQILPRTKWQHITFTIPMELWDFFWCNRPLLNRITKIAANCIQKIAKIKGVTPGVFTALHTFGRDLKRNVHVHLSTTTGGLSNDLKTWKNLFFHQTTLMKLWRYAVIKLFRQEQVHLVIPPNIKKHINPTFSFNKFLDQLYQKTWIIHCSKPSANHKHTVRYLGGYVKRPPIAESKLKHYDGHEIVLKYLDHKTNTYSRLVLNVQDFIGKFVQHIPDKGFRMIRYYGFLSHRVRGKLLPIVYNLLGQTKPEPSAPPTYAQLIQKEFSFNPLTCILCGSQLILTAVRSGVSSIDNLLSFHYELACFKKI